MSNSPNSGSLPRTSSKSNRLSGGKSWLPLKRLLADNLENDAVDVVFWTNWLLAVLSPLCVFLHGRYEVQLLDSYRNPSYPDGQAGALYGQTPPLSDSECIRRFGRFQIQL